MREGFKPIFTTQTRLLILGSAPSEISLQKRQYYGNNGNQFWKLLFSYFKEPLTIDYGKRVQLLIDNDIGLWDVYKSFDRKGSLDKSIKETTLNDFKLITSAAEIELIIANGKQSYKEIQNNHLFSDKNVICCTSTSGAANGCSKQRTEEWYSALNSVFKQN